MLMISLSGCGRVIADRAVVIVESGVCVFFERGYASDPLRSFNPKKTKT